MAIWRSASNRCSSEGLSHLNLTELPSPRQVGFGGPRNGPLGMNSWMGGSGQSYKTHKQVQAKSGLHDEMCLSLRPSSVVYWLCDLDTYGKLYSFNISNVKIIIRLYSSQFASIYSDFYLFDDISICVIMHKNNLTVFSILKSQSFYLYLCGRFFFFFYLESQRVIFEAHLIASKQIFVLPYYGYFPLSLKLVILSFEFYNIFVSLSSTLLMLPFQM